MRIQAPRFSARFRPPNPPVPSLISVCAEVAIRTTPRIHAGFGAVVCAEHRMAVGRNKLIPALRPLRYDASMHISTGAVIQGQVVLHDDTLPEGAVVNFLTGDTEASVRLSPTEEACLMSALDDADRESGMAADEILARQRRFG